MPREMLPDGTYREVTWDEIRANRHEDEVLFRAGTRFEVLKRYDGDGGTVHIVMEEVDDD